MLSIHQGPDYDRLRSDPRFQDDSPRDLIVKEHGLANPLPTGKLTNGLDQEEETQAFGVSSGRRRIGRSASPGRIVAK
jgi:hypothetical protein